MRWAEGNAPITLDGDHLQPAAGCSDALLQHIDGHVSRLFNRSYTGLSNAHDSIHEGATKGRPDVA